MPTINFETAPNGVSLRGIVYFVKLVNRRATPYGSDRSRTYTVVHIENEHDRPYGGQSLTYCGRLFETGNYLFIQKWLGHYQICRQCHARAEKRNSAYREALDATNDGQLALAFVR